MTKVILYAIWKDQTAPAMGSISYSPTTWTKGNVTITAKATDVGSGLVAYQFSTSSSLTASSTGWTSITATTSEITKTYSASSNGTYYFYVKDSAGNINKKSVAITKIDKTKPTITTPTASNISDSSLVINTTFNDANSGLSKLVVYYKTSSSNEYITKTETYTTMNGGTTGATGNQTKAITLTNLAQGTTYNVYIIGYDVAGNSIQSTGITVTTKKYIAQIGSTKYEKLASAINAVKDNQSTDTTILMLNNTSESVTIPSTKSIILDLSGKTVTGNMVNQGKLTITGEGTLTATKGVTLTNEKTLYIEKVTITNKEQFEGTGYVFKNNTTGTAYMNNGNIVQLYGSTHTILNSGTLNINGGEIRLDVEGSGSTALYIADAGKVNMSNGLITSKGFALCVDDGSFKGTGGTLQASSGERITAIVRNVGNAEFTSMKIIHTIGGSAVSNQTGKGSSCVIRSRDSNYGVTGSIGGVVVATTNVGPGQTKENVTIYNPGTSQVQFPNWTQKNGQDDIDWRTVNVSGNSATTTINAKPKDEGEYYVHIYQFSNGATRGFLGDVTLYFYDDSTELISFDAKFENITSTSYDVVIYNINCLYGVKNIQVPTWSATNGQDDIKWLNATKQANGTYKAHVDRSEYVDTGIFKSHVYVYDTVGNVKTVDVGTVELSGWGQWHSSTWKSVWNNGCYEISVLWSYRQDGEANQTQIRLEQLRCSVVNPAYNYYNYEGSTALGIAGVGNTNSKATASPAMTVNSSSPYTWDNGDIITTVTHNADGSWPNPAGQFMWRANIGQYNTPEIGWSNFYVSVPNIAK